MSEGFAAVPNWMIRDESVSRRALLVYAALASRSGKGGIFPSQKQLAADSRCDERTVRRALRELEELGVVERVRRANALGHRLSDGYVLHPNGRDDETEPYRADLSGRDGGLPDTSAGPTGQNEQVAPYIEEEPFKKSRVPRPQKPLTTIPEFFTVTPAMREWARVNAPAVHVDRETRRFVSYWSEGLGAGRRYRDWIAAWRTWMSRAQADAERRGWRPPREAEMVDFTELRLSGAES